MSEKKEKGYLEEITGEIKTAFNEAGIELKTATKEVTDDLRDGINAGRDALGKGYAYVEETVGKDRIAGAALGMKVGGLWGVRAGLFGIGIGGLVGGAVGFAAGRKLYTWLEAGRANDNAQEPQQKPANKSGGPSDPAP